jgi:hypothetical protein
LGNGSITKAIYSQPWQFELLVWFDTHDLMLRSALLPDARALATLCVQMFKHTSGHFCTFPIYLIRDETVQRREAAFWPARLAQPALSACRTLPLVDYPVPACAGRQHGFSI